MSVDKVKILNMVKNIAEPNRSRIQHAFNRWKSSMRERRIGQRLVLTPISKDDTSKARIDYEEQMVRIRTGESHVWDDSKQNNACIGDYFAYVENQVKIGKTDYKSEGKISIYKIEGVFPPEMRLQSWSGNVGQTDRNVVVLSKKCYYTGTIVEFKEISGYAKNWNSQGTSGVVQEKSMPYLEHILYKR